MKGGALRKRTLALMYWRTQPHVLSLSLPSLPPTRCKTFELPKHTHTCTKLLHTTHTNTRTHERAGMQFSARCVARTHRHTHRHTHISSLIKLICVCAHRVKDGDFRASPRLCQFRGVTGNWKIIIIKSSRHWKCVVSFRSLHLHDHVRSDGFVISMRARNVEPRLQWKIAHARTRFEYKHLTLLRNYPNANVGAFTRKREVL